MKEFIARENIRRFKAQLAGCIDPEQRRTLERLLEAERHQLAEALAEKAATRRVIPIPTTTGSP